MGPNVSRAALSTVLPCRRCFTSELRRRILNDDLAAGERLLESKIAEEFGVSRTTVRSALRGLAPRTLWRSQSAAGAFRRSHARIGGAGPGFARFLL